MVNIVISRAISFQKCKFFYSYFLFQWRTLSNGESTRGRENHRLPSNNNNNKKQWKHCDNSFLLSAFFRKFAVVVVSVVSFDSNMVIYQRQDETEKKARAEHLLFDQIMQWNFYLLLSLCGYLLNTWCSVV